MDLSSGVTRQLFPRGELEDLFSPLWSPSGAFIAAVANGKRCYCPIVINMDGTPMARGEGPRGGGPPPVAWRVGTDTLLYGEGRGGIGVQRPAGIGLIPRDLAARLWAIGPPSWRSDLLVSLPGQERAEILSSPDGRAVLLQTLDLRTLLETGVGAQGTPYRWTVIDLVTADQTRWKLTDVQALDWR